jgi:peptide/nickel transport system substrate-binding protein
VARVALAAIVGGASCVAAPRDRDVVVIASGADLESGNPLVTIHPLSRQVHRFVLFTTLARYDSTLTPAPYLARRWEWSADRRALTFTLVRGVRWHDGVPTTAHDAAFTLDAARDPATGYPRAADLAAVSAVEAGDDTTLVVRFAAPQPEFPSILCELPILPRHRLAAVPRAAMKRASFNLAPLGNGPWRFVRRDPGARWVFARNADFPAALGGPPRAAGVVIAVVDEATTKFAALASGELDVAGISPTMAALAERDPSMRLLTYPVLFSTALVFNTHRPPFDDVRVRRAVSLSVDRRRLVDAALAGHATPAAGPVPPESPLALRASPAADTLRADALLDSAGWRREGRGVRARGGRALAVELLTVGSGDNAVEQLLQADLAARGIRLEIRQTEMGAFLARARAARKDFDLLVTGVPGDLSLSFLGAMHDSRQAGGALDYAGFHTAVLDAAFAAVRQAGDTAAIRRAWVAVQQELAREMPVAWLYHSRGVQGVSARLRGVTMDLRGEMPTIARWERVGEP